MQLAKAEAAEKFRIEGGSEAQRCPRIAGAGRALVKQACRSDVAVAQKSVAMVDNSAISALENREVGGVRAIAAGEVGGRTGAFAGAAEVSAGAFGELQHPVQVGRTVLSI